jgi:hypothetical protein
MGRLLQLAMLGVWMLVAAPSASIAATREPPDSKNPTAGICLPVQPGSMATFTIGIDAARPRCGEVLPSQRLSIANERPELATVTFHYVRYAIRPGATLTFPQRFGEVWEPGVHILRYSVNGIRNGIDVVLVGDFPNTATEPPQQVALISQIGVVVLCLGLAFASVRLRSIGFAQYADQALRRLSDRLQERPTV